MVIIRKPLFFGRVVYFCKTVFPSCRDSADIKKACYYGPEIKIFWCPNRRVILPRGSDTACITYSIVSGRMGVTPIAVLLPPAACCCVIIHYYSYYWTVLQWILPFYSHYLLQVVVIITLLLWLYRLFFRRVS